MYKSACIYTVSIHDAVKNASQTKQRLTLSNHFYSALRNTSVEYFVKHLQNTSGSVLENNSMEYFMEHLRNISVESFMKQFCSVL